MSDKGIEEALEHLLDSGLLKLPESERDKSSLEYIQPSDEAKAVGKKIRQRILSQLGLSELGAYISRERESQGIDRRELARQVMLAQEVVMELETSKMEFFFLSPKKAADIVQYLDLDPAIVLQYLALMESSQQTDQVATPLFRVNKDTSDDQRKTLTQRSQQSLSGSARDQLQRFVKEFSEELKRRGLAK